MLCRWCEKTLEGKSYLKLIAVVHDAATVEYGICATDYADMAASIKKRPVVNSGGTATATGSAAGTGGRPPCLCGCGGTPASKGAKFLPGHDARYHAAQKAASK